MSFKSSLLDQVYLLSSSIKSHLYILMNFKSYQSFSLIDFFLKRRLPLSRIPSPSFKCNFQSSILILTVSFQSPNPHDSSSSSISLICFSTSSFVQFPHIFNSPFLNVTNDLKASLTFEKNRSPATMTEFKAATNFREGTCSSSPSSFPPNSIFFHPIELKGKIYISHLRTEEQASLTTILICPILFLLSVLSLLIQHVRNYYRRNQSASCQVPISSSCQSSTYQNVDLRFPSCFG